MSRKIDRQNWDILMDIYKTDFPEVKFAYKHDPPDNLKIKAVFLFVRIVSFFNADFMDWYLRRSVTVIDNWILFPASHDWTQEHPDYRTFKVLVHELRHLYQRRENALWELRYVLFPLPIIITERGYRWELEAYGDSMWCDMFFVGYLQVPLSQRASSFVSVDYFWMSGFTEKAKHKVLSQLQQTLAKIVSDEYVPVTDKFVRPAMGGM